MNSRKLFLLFALIVAAIVVVAGVIWAQWPAPLQTPVEGFKPFASFRTSDAPGSVFRQSSQGDIRKVIDLRIPSEKASEVTYDIEAKRDFSAEQLLSIASGDNQCTPASANFKPSAKFETIVSSLEGFREFTYDQQVDPALKQLEQMFVDGELVFRRDDVYWIIRETISTSEISYSSNRSLLVDLGGDVALKQCVDQGTAANGSVSLDLGSSEKVTLKRTFKEPLRGWYLADRLIIELPFGAAPGSPPEIRMSQKTEEAAPGAPDL